MTYNETLAHQVIAEVDQVTAGHPARWVTPQQIAKE